MVALVALVAEKIIGKKVKVGYVRIINKFNDTNLVLLTCEYKTKY